MSGASNRSLNEGNSRRAGTALRHSNASGGAERARRDHETSRNSVLSQSTSQQDGDSDVRGELHALSSSEGHDHRESSATSSGESNAHEHVTPKHSDFVPPPFTLVDCNTPSAVAVVGATEKYLKKHDVISEVHTMVRQVLSPAKLPFSPYPQLRQLALVRHERLRMGESLREPGKLKQTS